MSIWNQVGGAASAGRRKLALWALCAVLPILSLSYQVVAKEIAQVLGQTPFGLAWIAQLVHLPWALLLLAIEIASFAAWMTALSQMKLSAAFPMSAVSYVLIIVTSWTLFGEPASAQQVIGGAIILTGIWLIGRSEPEAVTPP